MNGGAKTALLISGAALAGCSTTHAVEIRPIADRSAALASGDALTVARGQFMLGNVGLALEAFRKAQRENPNDPRVISGIGDCYAAMGRFDIAESTYEIALSLAPRDHVLLMGLASVLERSGQAKRASDIRAEAERFEQTAALLAAQARARALAAAKAAEAPPQIASASASVTVALPPARPPKHAARPARDAPAIQSVASAAPIPVPIASAQPASPRVASAPGLGGPALSQQAAVNTLATAPLLRVVPLPAQAAGDATVIEADAIEPTLPERAAAERVASEPSMVVARGAVQVATLTAPHVPVPVLALDQRLAGSVAMVPLAPAPRPRPSPAVALPVRLAEPASPRLERLNRGEVALVTTGSVVWRPRSSVRMAAADSVRWVPLPLSRARGTVQVLNAARSQGLAASARSVLVGRGWREIGIGNASAVRRTSIVFYPSNRAALGRRLAAQFGVPARVAEQDHVVLVLGRDSMSRIAGKRRS